MVMAPIVRGRKGEYGRVLEELRAEGFQRVKVDGELRQLEAGTAGEAGGGIALDKKFKHDISVVVDRLVMRPDLRKRLADSIETAVALADGMIEIETVPREGSADPPTVTLYSEKFACPDHGPVIPELEPRIFSFNSPHGACPRCTGLGSQMEIDPDLVVPDGSLSLGEGALAPWAGSASQYYDQIQQAIAERYGVDVETPWDELPADAQELFLHGTNGERVQVTYRNRYGRKRSYATRFEGIIPGLERRYRETESDLSREKIEEFMSVRPCPSCKGSRLKPESRAVLVGGIAIHELTAMSVRRALAWLDEVQLTETERHIARLIVREIEERLRFLENVGIGYLSMDRAAATLSGGEAQRIRLATQIGSALVGVLYVLDEPSIGLHQRDNAKLIGTLERLRDLGNTVLVVEHDEQTMRAADHLVDLGPGAGEHGGRVIAAGTRGGGRARGGVAHRPVPVRGARDPAAREAPHALGLRRDPRRQAAQPARHRRQGAARPADLRHGRLGLGQVDAGQRGALQGGQQPPAPRAPAGRGAHGGAGARPARQDHPGRPVADRAHAALEPRDLHRAVRRHPRPLRQDARGACARLQAGPLLLQRQGRALRGLPRRRPDQDRDALPARRVRPVRAVPRQALQPRDARHPLQGQDDLRRARDAGRGGRRVLRQHPEDPPPAGDAQRRRARLHPPRPAGDDAVGRRGAARQARHRAEQGGDRPHPLHPRRADDRPALRRRRAPARGAAAPRGRRATPSW